MTTALTIVALLLCAGMGAVFRQIVNLTESSLRHAERLSHLEAGRGTLTSLCCDLERQVHVLQNRVDNLHHAVASLADNDDQPFEPDTDMED